MKNILKLTISFLLCITVYMWVHAFDVRVNSDKQQQKYYNQNIDGNFQFGNFSQFEWRWASNWTTCNKTCGGWIQYRSLQGCFVVWESQRVSNAACTQPVPGRLQQSCNTQACVPRVNGRCSTTVNQCLAWWFSDRTDTSTQHLWSCLGSWGWNNQQCSATKSSFDCPSKTFTRRDHRWGTYTHILPNGNNNDTRDFRDAFLDYTSCCLQRNQNGCTEPWTWYVKYRCTSGTWQYVWWTCRPS